MTFPGALGRSTRPWSQAMLSTGFGRAPKSVTSRAAGCFCRKTSASVAALVLPVAPRDIAHGGGRDAESCLRRLTDAGSRKPLDEPLRIAIFFQASKWCVPRRRKTGIRMMKNGRILQSTAGCLGSVRGSHAGHKASLFSQPLFPVPSSARAFLAAGNSTSVWNACLVSGNSSAVEETREKERGERSERVSFPGRPDASSLKKM